MSYKIQPLIRDEISTLMSIAQLSVGNDTHTRMKMFEKGVTDLGSELEPLNSIEYQFDHPSVKMMKAVNKEGKMVGYSNWRMWNFEKDLSLDTANHDNPEEPLDAKVNNPDYPILPTQSPLEQLEAQTSGHLMGMMSRVNTPTSRTLFCLGISVHPDYQSKGVASALLQWATHFADEHHARAWVHISDHPGAVKVFEKSGFRNVNELKVDLDEHARKGHPEGGKWGEYTFRFMLREPV
ncbi:hypothetical protein BKA70DRAFT_1432156 [Coprinopsis sp. MPI-PUGE-AT-0042]|nr:hypothetical protein BKA70DRAFT_1432156 [Coprinopsis sp. MPI-PUGE-AT-0042]